MCMLRAHRRRRPPRRENVQQHALEALYLQDGEASQNMGRAVVRRCSSLSLSLLDRLLARLLPCLARSSWLQASPGQMINSTSYNTVFGARGGLSGGQHLRLSSLVPPSFPKPKKTKNKESSPQRCLPPYREACPPAPPSPSPVAAARANDAASSTG